MDTPTVHSALGMALRGSLAAVVSLVLAEWWHLEYANLAVWTTHMVTVQYPFTAFQKGVERTLGRGLGILVGWVILTLFYNAPVLALAMELVALLACFYVYFSGRLAYTFLNAGFYLAGILSIGIADPSAAFQQGKAFFWAVLLGVVVADLLMWLTGGESDLRIQVVGEPLLPLNHANLNHSLMLVVTVALTQLVTSYLDLPTTAVITAMMVLTITPDVHEMLKKNQLRIFGAVFGTVWGIGSLLLVIQLPHIPLQAALLFLGIFVSAYLARASRRYSLVGVQMGLVLPLALVMPLRESVNIHAGLQRLEGMVTAVVMLVLVSTFWTSFGRWRGLQSSGYSAAQR